MSILEAKTMNDAGCEQATCQAIKLLIEPREKDLGGFSVRRILPYAKQRMVGPWIFFDHMGPANFEAGQGINVRPHPHIHLATVTYLFEGEILHQDSLGSCQPIRPGAINLMVAGRGITHSEREREEVHNQPHCTHGLQLWHALPKAQEDIDPAFYHYAAGDLPEVEQAGARLRVMMGKAYGKVSPVQTFVPTLFVEAKLEAGAALELPQAEELAMYVVSGQLELDSQNITAHHMAIVSADKIHAVRATEDTHFVIIGGQPLGERFVEWNFVSSRKEAIEQAKRDWKEGKFPKVPGDEEEYIPLPE